MKKEKSIIFSLRLNFNQNFFLRLVQFFLFITASGKTLLLIGKHPFLRLYDPIFHFITERQVVALATFLEWSGLAFLQCSRISRYNKWLFVYSLGWCFVWYRAIEWVQYGRMSCLCVGLLSWNSPLISAGLFAVACFFIGVGLVGCLQEFQKT